MGKCPGDTIRLSSINYQLSSNILFLKQDYIPVQIWLSPKKNKTHIFYLKKKNLLVNVICLNCFHEIL